MRDVTNLTNEVNKLSEMVENQEHCSRCNGLLLHEISEENFEKTDEISLKTQMST